MSEENWVTYTDPNSGKAIAGWDWRSVTSITSEDQGASARVRFASGPDAWLPIPAAVILEARDFWIAMGGGK